MLEAALLWSSLMTPWRTDNSVYWDRTIHVFRVQWKCLVSFSSDAFQAEEKR